MTDHPPPPAPEPAPSPAPSPAPPAPSPAPIPPAPQPAPAPPVAAPPPPPVSVISDDRIVAAERDKVREMASHVAQVSAIADAYAALSEPRPDHEVWLSVFTARTTGSSTATATANYADAALTAYKQRFKQSGGA